MPYEIEVTVDEAFAGQVDAGDLAATAEVALRHQGQEQGDLTIAVTDDERVAELNRQYRAVDGPTDVLSFAAQEGDVPNDLPPDLAAELQSYLGDLVIAYPYTAAQAQRYGNPLDAELRLLVVHGVLHLLGHDHDTDERQAAMWAAQAAILAELGDRDTNWEREDEA